MTQTRVAAEVEWAHALPYTAGRQVGLFSALSYVLMLCRGQANDLKSLGLVKGSFHLEDSSNLVPRTHAFFLRHFTVPHVEHSVSRHAQVLR